jgi:hypothetical protein
LSALLHHLVAPSAPRSGFANVHLVPVRKGVPVTFGSEVEWKHRFSPEQLNTAPLSLRPVLESNSVALLPGSSPELTQGLRTRGFAAARYELTPEEFAWVISTLPAEKAEKWKQGGERAVTMVVCAGQVVVKTEGVLFTTQERYCQPPAGLKLEEVAPVEGSSVISDLGAAIGSGLQAAFNWVSPGSVKNAAIYSSSSEPTEEQRKQAERFVAEYDRMAASVRDMERLVDLGAPMPREVAVRLQMSKMMLAQSAQPVAEIRKAMGKQAPGSSNRKDHGRTHRNRGRDTYGSLSAYGAIPVALVLYCVIAVSFSAAVIYAAGAFSAYASETTKQVDANIKYRQDLLAKCTSNELPAAVRNEVCKAVREDAKNPIAGSGPGVDWSRVAMWGGIGLLGIGGAFAISSVASTAKPVVVAASQRMRQRNKAQGRQQFSVGD